MKKSISALAFTLMSSVAVADPAVGQWVTIDDEDGSQASVVDIRINEEGKLQGTIVKLLREKDQGKSCEKCPDDFKDQPVEGLTFMWDLENEGNGEWESGRILDPKSGSVYKSQLNVAEDGQSLSVRGYIGVSWIGRSQTWLRYEAPVTETAAETAEAAPADVTAAE
ncbi:MAG: DUF2147 domain-containing protein [Saccharospirillaceae bacterium]|nr:DUF2147 domain-containing protein [Saccharospirillaceae bacterium]MCD8531004.1 DUF2147 domain-containing protein [Saccharospirillaceae bacterium]